MARNESVAPTESEILAAVLKRLGREPDLVLWRMNQGAGHMVTKERLLEILAVLGNGKLSLILRVERAVRMIRDILTKKFAQYGLVNGASDLIGVLTVPVTEFAGANFLSGRPGKIARFFALEIKARRGRLSKDQQLFLDLVRAKGGFAACIGIGCRDVDEVIAAAQAALARARRGESE